MAAITPIIYTWEAQNTAGDTKRKVTSAIVLIGMCTGNVGTRSTLDVPRTGIHESILVLTFHRSLARSCSPPPKLQSTALA